MAFVDHIDFLRVFHKVMSYQIEEGDNLISEKEFFDYLYSPSNKNEDFILRYLLKNENEFSIVQGPIGGGKTTLLRKFKHDYELNKGNDCFYINFKKEASVYRRAGKSLTDEDLFIEGMIGKEAILNIFKRRLTEGYLNDIEIQIDFTLTALIKFFKVNRLQLKLQEWGLKLKDSKIGNNKEDFKGIKNHLYTHPDIHTEEYNFVKDNLGIGELIYVIKIVNKFENFYLLFDNGDRLHPNDQAFLLKELINIHQEGDKSFGMVIALRDKNLKVYEAGFGGTIVLVFNSFITEPRKLEDPTDNFSKDVLERRYKFLEQYDPLKINEREKLHSINVDKYNKSKDLFDKLKKFVNSEFMNEKLFNFSNHSVRQLLVLNEGFMRYLFELAEEKGVIIDSNGEIILNQSNIKSYIYRWLYVTNIKAFKLVPSFIKDIKAYNKDKDNIHEIFLSFYILLWLVNSKKYFIYRDTLLKALEIFYIDEKIILDCIHKRLYDVPIINRFVELGQVEMFISEEILRKENVKITLTPFGKDFIRFMMNKFEFLYAALAIPFDDVEKERKIYYEPVLENMDDKIDLVLGFLRKYKVVQDDLMKKVQKWEVQFRNEFCIDGEKPIERIVRSHLAYLKQLHPFNVRTEIKLKKYNELLG